MNALRTVTVSNWRRCSALSKGARVDAIPAWIQAIAAVFTTILLLVTSILAILGYLKIIKTSDENAKERQKAIEDVFEKTSKAFNDLSQKAGTSIKKDSWLVKIFVITAAFIVAMNIYNTTQLRKKVEKMQAEKEHR